MSVAGLADQCGSCRYDAVVERLKGNEHGGDTRAFCALAAGLAEPPPLLTEFENNPEHPTAPMRRAGQFAAFTPPFNMSGQPAINLPLHRNAEGLPIGIQLAAGYGREDVLIRVAAQLESAHPWSADHPAIR